MDRPPPPNTNTQITQKMGLINYKIKKISCSKIKNKQKNFSQNNLYTYFKIMDIMLYEIKNEFKNIDKKLNNYLICCIFSDEYEYSMTMN